MVPDGRQRNTPPRRNLNHRLLGFVRGGGWREPGLEYPDNPGDARFPAEGKRGLHVHRVEGGMRPRPGGDLESDYLLFFRGRRNLPRVGSDRPPFIHKTAKFFPADAPHPCFRRYTEGELPVAFLNSFEKWNASK